MAKMIRRIRIEVLFSLFLGITACSSDDTDSSPGSTPDIGTSGKADAQGNKDVSVDAPLSSTDLIYDQGLTPDNCVPTITNCEGFCGTIKDKCTGQELKCGTCSTGQVCDLVSHTCIIPKIDCEQLGAECGLVKNGCGNHIDCGNCPVEKECDPDTHTCVACKEVKCSDLGYECGMAWLGCGPLSNTTDCGICSLDKRCNNAFNICEPACEPKPTEQICNEAKVSKGVECGYISNGCGGVVFCGDCPDGEKCGMFGVANRCDPIPEPEECIAAGRNCGEMDSVCGGKINCGTCTEKDHICNSNGVCGPPCKKKVCTDFAPAECGAFDDGCNGTLTCTCPGSGAICKADHTCCTNTAKCQSGTCNITLKNTCTDANIYCNTCTPNTQYCDKTSNTCKNKNTCNTYNAGGSTNEKCNDNLFYDAGDGTKFACPCTGTGRICINDSPTQEGTCCTNQNPTCPSTGAGWCHVKVTNSCTNEETECQCNSGYHCEDDQCVPNFTCDKYGANGDPDNPCSNGASSSFPRGDGTNLTCPCDSGYVCVDTQNVVVKGDAVGTCKKKKTCKEDYNATGVVGSICNDNKYFSDGYGSLFSCPCNTSNGYTNNKCEGDTSSQAGTCQCVKKTCHCGNIGQSDGCGGYLSCAKCPDGTTCNTTNGACCPNLSCTNLPAGLPAGACGTISNSCLGTSFQCSCDTSGGKTNNKCILTSGQTWGTCQCTKFTCAEVGAGTWPDGCGTMITCSN